MGLSLGSYEGVDAVHLERLRTLFDRFEPDLVSEHVSWSVTDGVYLNDLLPLPYTEEALAVVIRNVEHTQSAFGRQILIENPSTYVAFAVSAIPEWEFMTEIATRTGCGILLDVNNIHVSAVNHGLDSDRYVDSVPEAAVKEIHVAGHSVREFDGGTEPRWTRRCGGCLNGSCAASDRGRLWSSGTATCRRCRGFSARRKRPMSSSTARAPKRSIAVLHELQGAFRRAILVDRI